jgi:hypothetical protein
MSIIDTVLKRWDEFTFQRERRLQQVFGFQSGRVQTYRRQPFQSAEPQKRAIPLFGSEPGAFGEDWADYRVAQVKGSGPQPVQPELKIVDANVHLEDWKPDPSIPSLVSHGKRLNYENQSDQRPVVSFQGEVADKWDGVIRSNTPKKSFETSRRGGDKTEADRQRDLKRYPFDFSV